MSKKPLFLTLFQCWPEWPKMESDSALIFWEGPVPPKGAQKGVILEVAKS